MKIVRINNKRASIILLPAVAVARAKGQKGTFKSYERMPDTNRGDVLVEDYTPKQLVPGINKLSDNYYAVLKKHPGVQHLFACEILEEVASGEPLIPDTVKTTLKDMSEPTAIDLVNDAGHIPQLNRWFENDSRPKVQDAIIRRIEHLEGTSTKVGNPKAEIPGA